jgi:hypothetical protein
MLDPSRISSKLVIGLISLSVTSRLSEKSKAAIPRYTLSIEVYTYVTLLSRTIRENLRSSSTKLFITILVISLNVSNVVS